MEKISLDKAKEIYNGEWIAFTVEEKTPEGELIGTVVAHNVDRRELHKELRRKKIKNVYVTFAGPVPKPGYVIIL